jgi:hypothetical protein
VLKNKEPNQNVKSSYFKKQFLVVDMNINLSQYQCHCTAIRQRCFGMAVLFWAKRSTFRKFSGIVFKASFKKVPV